MLRTHYGEAVRLYSGSSEEFVEDVTNARIVPKLEAAFRDTFGWSVGDGERASWSNSLEKVRNLIVAGGLDRKGVLLEYLLPASDRRLDCLVTGQTINGSQSATILELKQWTECKPSPLLTAVETKHHGRFVDNLHPSVQVGQYHEYLLDFQTAFQGTDPIELHSCAYLHNYNPELGDPLLDAKFDPWITRYPVFFERNFEDAKRYLIESVGAGPGLDALSRIETSGIKPSQGLVDHLGDVLSGKSEYKLLDDQRLVYDRVLRSLESALTGGTKTVVIALGGPGTGKTVIAMNLMAALMQKHKAAVQFVTGSGAFTRTMRESLDSRIGRLFKFTNNYVRAEPNSFDALIVDEAHRLRSYSTSFTGRRTSREGDFQVDEIIRAGKVTLFLIDDLQAVTSKDAGSSEHIRDRARLQHIPVHEYKLSIQFRCKGAETFVGWLDSVLGLSDAAIPRWKDPPGFEFKIFDSPVELDTAIQRLNSSGKSARLTAGYCWKWSPPSPDGLLKNDVVVDGLSRPWNAKEGRGAGPRLAPGIPPAQLWATAPGGENQIGCVYTAQGFEFGTVGVIFGPDLRYDEHAGSWVGDPDASFDSDLKKSGSNFTRLVKHCYRVLLTRGIEACWVYFMDESTRRYFETRMARA